MLLHDPLEAEALFWQTDTGLSDRPPDAAMIRDSALLAQG